MAFVPLLAYTEIINNFLDLTRYKQGTLKLNIHQIYILIITNYLASLRENLRYIALKYGGR